MKSQKTPFFGNLKNPCFSSKLFIIALLLAVSVVAQQNMSGSISQPVVGSFVLGAYQSCIGQDRQMLFGPTGPDNISANDCFRIDFFEVNGMLTGCEDELCDLVTTLNDELQITYPHTTKETTLVDDLLIQLDDSTTCLLGVYNGSMFNGTAGSIRVGAKTYFNTVKPCYVRTIAALGSLEQIYIDEPNASFLVQKLQALEVDYQQLLTMEDLKAIKIFNVMNSTLTGTVTGAPEGVGEMFFKDDALFNPVAGADYWSAKWTECAGESQESCFETQKIALSQNYIDLVCDPIGNWTHDPLEAPINTSTLINCNVWQWTQKELLECNCYNMVVNRIMEIDNCFTLQLCPDPNYPNQPTDALATNTCKQCLAGGLYPTGGAAAQSDLDSLLLTISPYQPGSVSPQATSYLVTVADYDTVDSIAVPALGKIVVIANMNQPTLSYGPGGVTISADSRFNVIYQNYQSTGQGQMLTLIFTIQPGAMGSSPGYQFTINNAGNNDPDMEAVYVRIDTGNRGEAVGLGAGLENNEGVYTTAGYSQPTSSTTLGVGASQASSANSLTKYLYFNAAGELVVEYDATAGLTNALATLIVGHNDPDGITYTGEFDNVNNWLNLVLGSFKIDFVKGYSTVRDTDKDEITASDIDVAETDVIATAGIAWSMAEYATNDNHLDKNQNQAIPEIQPTSKVIFANPASTSGASDTTSVDVVDENTPTKTINVAFKVAVSATYDPTGIPPNPAPTVTTLPFGCTISNLPVTSIDLLTGWALWSVMIYCDKGITPASNTITVTATKTAGTANTNWLFRITEPNGNTETGLADPNSQIALGASMVQPGCLPFTLGAGFYTPLPPVGQNDARFTGIGGIFPVNIISGPVSSTTTYGNTLFAANVLSPAGAPAFAALPVGKITQFSSCTVDGAGLVFSALFYGSFPAPSPNPADIAVSPSNCAAFSVNPNGAIGTADFALFGPTGELGVSSTPTGGFGIENINASPTLALAVAALIVLIVFLFLLRKRSA